MCGVSAMPSCPDNLGLQKIGNNCGIRAQSNTSDNIRQNQIQDQPQVDQPQADQVQFDVQNIPIIIQGTYIITHDR